MVFQRATVHKQITQNIRGTKISWGEHEKGLQRIPGEKGLQRIPGEKGVTVI